MAAFRDMEEVSQGLLSLLGTNRAEAQQRRLLGRHERVVERLLETQDGAEQRLREILAAEKEVAQSLLDAKEQAHQGGVKLQQLEAELQRASEEDAHLKASLVQLTRELEELKEIEADLERQEREVDEDTTVTIPSAVYVAQLYRRIMEYAGLGNQRKLTRLCQACDFTSVTTGTNDTVVPDDRFQVFVTCDSSLALCIRSPSECHCVSELCWEPKTRQRGPSANGGVRSDQMPPLS
ncbi:kinetochore protein Spc24 isoform X2 [Hippopotamus amphibius kiboko]|uniref:kinetochore protein Spc24 isoform X2 n=1 Tax=Hippopotamus amphibius kiboko TaxID=575201 RepID=UPI00259A93AF|nr:kinetochore protein Spc24 isoform X2 [Hippopotamus amphibius kiboko]